MPESVTFNLCNVAKSFGRRHVLEDVNLAVRRGELVAVTGENGAGKSTLLKIAVGLLRQDRGDVSSTGRIGYCPQEPHVFERLTVAENFAYFAAAYGLLDWRQKSSQWMSRFEFTKYSDCAVSELSGGTRQKLNLSLAVIHEPEILLLDEPYSGFDWETYLTFWELAGEWRRAGRAILVVSHFVYDSNNFDRICSLHGGKLQCG